MRRGPDPYAAACSMGRFARLGARPRWHEALAALHAGRPAGRGAPGALGKRGMLGAGGRGMSGYGKAAFMAAEVGVPVHEMRALASLYVFRKRIEAGAAALAGVPMHKSALARHFAGCGSGRLDAALGRLEGRGLAARRGRGHASITDAAFALLAGFDAYIEELEGGGGGAGGPGARIGPGRGGAAG